MVNIVKKFNIIAEDLLRQTAHLIGSTYLTKFKTVILFNSSVPIEKFKLNLLPYKNYIINKDTEFFMNSEINLSETNKKYYNDMIDLKDIFSKIDNESKENIWEILQALIILCEAYLNKHVTTSNHAYL